MSGHKGSGDQVSGDQVTGEQAAQHPGAEDPAGERCRWCGTIFLTRRGPGRPRVYCSQSCRQQHYVERRTAVGDGRDPDRVVVPRSTFDRFESKRLQLKLALDDVDRAKASSGAVRAELYEWVLEYARDVVAVDLQSSDDTAATDAAVSSESLR